MIKTTILAAIILFLGTMMVQEVYAPNAGTVDDIKGSAVYDKAIPDWIKTQFEWYINEEIDEKTLLTSMNWMFDNNVMHLSEKAAQEVQDMRNEINDLKQDLKVTKATSGVTGAASTTDELGRIKVQFHWGTDKEDINQFIDEMKKSIDSLPTEQQSHAISSLRTLVTTQAMHSTGDGDGKMEIGINLIEKVIGQPLDWGTVMVYAIPIDKTVQSIDAELKILEQWLEIISKEQETSSYDASDRLTSGTTTELTVQYRESDLDFISRQLISIDQEIKALDTEIEVLKKKLQTAEDVTQMMQLELQDALNKQQQILQIMSNVSEMHHDTLKAIISNMRA